MFFYLGYILHRLNRFHFLTRRSNRYGAIDGLRGYLALSVFIHHFVLTWYWKSTGKWGSPPEAYFENLGKFGIAIFFMITGFLFISKILTYNGKMDWYRLYQSRLFRIYPLYFFVILFISSIILYQSGFTLNTNIPVLIKQYIKWFIFHGSVINDFNDTRRIIAGVDWTLKYEWLFYILLPLIAVIIRQGKLAVILLFAALLLLFINPLRVEYFFTRYFILFAIGGIAAVLYLKLQNHKTRIDSHIWSFIVLLMLLAALFYPDTFSPLHVLLMTLFFIPVALGNTLFGLFKTKASVYLGEISYSIYLLHGAVLYILFSAINIDISEISLVHFLVWLPFIGLLVILFSTLTYLYIEKPFLEYSRENNLIKNIKAFAAIKFNRNTD